MQFMKFQVPEWEENIVFTAEILMSLRAWLFSQHQLEFPSQISCTEEIPCFLSAENFIEIEIPGVTQRTTSSSGTKKRTIRKTTISTVRYHSDMRKSSILSMQKFTEVNLKIFCPPFGICLSRITQL